MEERKFDINAQIAAVRKGIIEIESIKDDTKTHQWTREKEC